MEYGRLIQRSLALFILLAALVLVIFILRRTRTVLSDEKTALGGAGILLLFTMIRIGSLSHIRIAMVLQQIFRRIHALEFLGLLLLLSSLLMNFFRLRLDAEEKRRV